MYQISQNLGSFFFSFLSPERPPELTSVFTDQIKLSSSSGKSSNRQQSSADSLSLRCSATGVPLPSIRWHLDGQELYSSSHVRIDSFTESSAVAPSSSMLGPQQQGNSAALKAYHLSRSVTSYLNISSLLVQVNKTKQMLVRGLEFRSFLPKNSLNLRTLACTSAPPATTLARSPTGPASTRWARPL